MTIIKNFEEWCERMINNPAFTNAMKQKTRTEKVFFVMLTNNGYILEEISSFYLPYPWGIHDFMKIVFMYVQFDIWIKDSREENVYITRKGYYKNGVILTGITEDLLENDRYPKICIGGKSDIAIHRDRMQALLPLHCEVAIVNHINGDKQNFSWENIEVSNASHNQLCSIYELGLGNGIPVKKIDEDDNFIIFPTTETTVNI